MKQNKNLWTDYALTSLFLKRKKKHLRGNKVYTRDFFHGQ